MSLPPDGRLHRLLGGEHLAPLRRRLRQRFERAALEEDPAKLRIDKLTPEEHAALVLLVGRAPRFSNSLQMDIRAVDHALRQAGIAGSLRDALEQLDGPIVHIATARTQWATLWSNVVDGCDHPALASFLRTPHGLGLLKRLSSRQPDIATRLRQRAEAVLHHLPAIGVTRAQLAADLLGDAHALDNGEPTATLILAVWRRMAVQRDAEAPLADTTEDGGARSEAREEKARDVWAKAGVLVNELARPAMFLNLPIREQHPYDQPPGEPGYISLRTLIRMPPIWAVAGRDVFVCENPNLLAIAADELGPRCAPMVCTDGMPAAAQNRLLAQLAQAGARLRYHGDFDWPGLRIANHVIREHGAGPWRFSTADYTGAVQTLKNSGQPLRGLEAAASWDVGLAPEMRAHQVAIAEEGVAASLLLDLGNKGQSHFAR